LTDRLEQAKCPQSPTKVHHWMILGTGAEPIGHCLFCGAGKQFKGSWDANWIDLGETHRRAIILAVAEAKSSAGYKI